MKGTLQFIVNLRSPSVEYPTGGSATQNRFSHVIKSDAKDIQTIMDEVRKSNNVSNMTEREVIVQIIKQSHEMFSNLSKLTDLSLPVNGNAVYIHPDDISFVTLVGTDDLKKVIEETV